jgi:DNA-binding XRE family transcriptional regulator
MLQIELEALEQDRRDPYWRERERYGQWPLPDLVLFGARVRRGRLQTGMSQRRLADRAGVSQSAISRLERGVAIGMTAIRLVAVCIELGPSFPFGSCPHEHTCAYPYDPRAPSEPRPHQPMLRIGR